MMPRAPTTRCRPRPFVAFDEGEHDASPDTRNQALPRDRKLVVLLAKARYRIARQGSQQFFRVFVGVSLRARVTTRFSRSIEGRARKLTPTKTNEIPSGKTSTEL